MKQMIFKRLHNPAKRRKVVVITSHTEDTQCKTMVRKSFAYKVTTVDGALAPVAEPNIFIHKKYDTKKRVERFNFRVKGGFYLTRERTCVRVDFHHALTIAVTWKAKMISPKQSEVLTE